MVDNAPSHLQLNLKNVYMLPSTLDQGIIQAVKLKARILTQIEMCTMTKICLYNFDLLKPHFYIVKLGFTGVYIIFLISAQNIDCGYSLEPPRRGGSNEYPQSMFWAEIWKILEYFIWKFASFCCKIFNIFQ